MTRTSRPSVTSALALLLLAACPPSAERAPLRSLGPTGSMQRPIIAGADDTGHPAIAYIEMYGQGACTGTLIASQWLVTAAHCTWDEANNRGLDNVNYYKVYFTKSGQTAPNVYDEYAVSEVHRHPNWDSPNIINDVAVLKLSRRPAVTPMPFLTSALASGNLVVGAQLEIAGFGLQDFPYKNCDPATNCPSGTKEKITVRLSTICSSTYGCNVSGGGHASPWTICYNQIRVPDGAAGGPCSGDSGGPAFLTVNGVQYVAGATSYGDQYCESFGCSTNLSKFESFLSQYVGAQKPLGATCSSVVDCGSGICVNGICCDQPCANACMTCTAATGGKCTPLNTPCNDGNPCTENDTCGSGSCNGTPKNCGLSSSCTIGGSCNLTTGNCEGGGLKADGSPCEDGNLCTQGDKCLAGQCKAGPAVNSCPSPDACHQASTCNLTTGRCDTFQASPNGTPCDDGDPCTGGDNCLSGTCLPSTRVSCPAPDACHTAGTCSSSTGKCPSTYPAKPNGTPCNDNNPCTDGDVCTAGVCAGTPNTKACAATTCHAAGTCSPSTGSCTGANAPDGTSCDDGDAATEKDVCKAGLCKGRPIGLDPCYGAMDGAACDDANKCTRNDFCVANVCNGTNPLPCRTPPSDCKESTGTCNWQTGECVYKSKANGVACDDGNAGTVDDHCENGRCAGTETECAGQADGTACSAGSCKDGACVNTPPPPAASGCGCATAGGSTAQALLLGALAFAVAGRRRRAP